MDAYLDSELALGKVSLALLDLLEGLALLLVAEAASDGTSLLGTEIEGEVLLVLVEETELLTLGSVDDGQNSGDRSSEIPAVERVNR